MESKTATIELDSSVDKVFSFLSQEENLPKWATEFCKELKKENGKYKVVTPMGEMFFRIDAKKDDGIIDMYYGHVEDKMNILTTKITKIASNSSKFACTCYHDPVLNDEQFEKQFESLNRELETLKNSFRASNSS